MLYWNNLMMLVATSANAEGGLGMTSAALDLSRQLSGIAEEVVIAGTIHVACFCTLILQWLLLI